MNVATCAIHEIDWLIVHYGWKESRLSDPKLRSFFVVIPIVVALGLAIPPLFLEMYNYPGRFICAICDYPYGCSKSDGVDCERGEGGVIYSNYSHGYTVLCAVIMVTFVCMLVYEIYKQERTLSRLVSASTVGGARRNANVQIRRNVETTKTAWRGIQYIGAYFLSYFPSFISLGYRATDPNLDIPDAIDYLFVILLPLLGFFNALVYFQPRYSAYKAKNPEADWIDRMSNVLGLFGKDQVATTNVKRESHGADPSQNIREVVVPMIEVSDV